MKIIEKINKAEKEDTVIFSLEFFPPKTVDGVQNLYSRLDRMAMLSPSWVDVTCGPNGVTTEKSLQICSTAQQTIGLETMIHVTCTNVSKEEIEDTLKQAKQAGVRNILALRGDPSKEDRGVFKHAVDLVRFIKEKYGDYFGICVAGYPETHLEAQSSAEDIEFLKEKVEAGADFVISQLFYDTSKFLKFVNDCRDAGIDCPIIPGLMPIQTYRGFQRMVSMCRTFVPQFILDDLEPIKNDDAEVKRYGIKLCTRMCEELIESGVRALHFYTLNLEKAVTDIVQNLRIGNSTPRVLPWRLSANSNRKEKEHVRPIFWSNRPTSYMSRTASWDEYPNGRWGDSNSPAYGEWPDYHTHVANNSSKRRKCLQVKWGPINKPNDVFDVFVKYCSGKIDELPWSDNGLQPETGVIHNQLLRMNKHGFLTINSQPRVNAAPSNDPSFGWGYDHGYVYQKAYLEFFTSPENKDLLLEELENYPSLQYHFVNKQGKSISNTTGATAVTWGAFPGREIIQPTVVDSAAFLIWKVIFLFFYFASGYLVIMEVGNRA